MKPLGIDGHPILHHLRRKLDISLEELKRVGLSQDDIQWWTVQKQVAEQQIERVENLLKEMGEF